MGSCDQGLKLGIEFWYFAMGCGGLNLEAKDLSPKSVLKNKNEAGGIRMLDPKIGLSCGQDCVVLTNGWTDT